MSVQSPGSLIILHGNTGRAGVFFNQVNGFTGNIVVSMRISPNVQYGPVAIFPYSYAELNATVPSEYNFTITTTTNTPIGLYNVTATGTSGALTHTATMTFGVSDAPVPSNGAELVFRLGFSARAYPGVTLFSVANFSDVGYLPVGITNIVINFDFGTYESAQGQSFGVNPLSQGTTGFAITIPTNALPGPHAFTATVTWVVAPGTLQQNQGPNIVSQGSLQVYANNPAQGIVASLGGLILPLFIIPIVTAVFSILLVHRHETQKQMRMRETGQPR